MPRALLSLSLLLLASSACRTTDPVHIAGEFDYVGSSTVGIFIEQANLALPELTIRMDVEPESDGGERAILAGTTDLAGLARKPDADVLAAGIAATQIGRDALAVIVPDSLPARGVTREQLRAIFTGEMTNWSALDGPDLEIHPLIAGPASATHGVFAGLVLDGAEYEGCEVIEVDSDIPTRVAGTDGAIGVISFAFLDASAGIRALAVDGARPSVSDFSYPIARPLYLLWRPGQPAVDQFVAWAVSADGQAIVQRNFAGISVVGSAAARPGEVRSVGTLVVNTETFQVNDGNLYFYPHRPYEILREDGRFVRRVRNHSGINDERAARVHLAPGTYLIRTETASGRKLEFYATIEAGRTTVLEAQEGSR